jgi:hypothetical protein
MYILGRYSWQEVGRERAVGRKLEEKGYMVEKGQL